MRLRTCLEPSIIACEIPGPDAVLHTDIMHYERVGAWNRKKQLGLGDYQPMCRRNDDDTDYRGERCGAQKAVDNGLCVHRLHVCWRLHERSVERLCNCFVSLEVRTFSDGAIGAAEDDLSEFRHDMDGAVVDALPIRRLSESEGGEGVRLELCYNEDSFHGRNPSWRNTITPQR